MAENPTFRQRFVEWFVSHLLWRFTGEQLIDSLRTMVERCCSRRGVVVNQSLSAYRFPVAWHGRLGGICWGYGRLGTCSAAQTQPLREQNGICGNNSSFAKLLCAQVIRSPHSIRRSNRHYGGRGGGGYPYMGPEDNVQTSFPDSAEDRF